MKSLIKRIWGWVAYIICRPLLGKPSEPKTVDIYASKMLTEFGWFHRVIFPRFFSKIRIDEETLTEVKGKIEGAIPIYVTSHIGQLEYNYFNYLFLNQGLPLAKYANDLATWQWMPLKISRQTKITQLKLRMDCGGSLPHPVSSGYVESLVRDGKSIFVRLKTTRIHDDLFWDIPEEDILQSLISTQRKIAERLMLIPQQFLWAKRPQKTNRSIIDWAFGERENPGRLRKIILFWRNYNKHAVVQFCEPLDLKDFIDAHPGIPETEMARILRNSLLTQISQERKRITGPAIKPRHWMIKQILEDEHVQKEIVKISTEKRKEIADVTTLAKRYATEMAADISYTYIEYATRVMDWVFHTMYDGIQHNSEALAKVKKIATNNPVIFVPNHLSHVDYLLISSLLYKNNVSVPHIAAGINMSFWPMGKLFRRCGAFFIRRTFGGNTLYKAVFESYIGLLLKEGYCQEFFIEGGRSRTGKLRQPRMGMLSTFTQIILQNPGQEIFFVPTSITYDKVVEESSHVDESAGIAKKKEKFSDVLKLRRYLKHRYGKIYVNFGTPISFVEVQTKISERNTRENIKPKIVELLAFKIMSSLSKNSVATPSALVAAAFLMERKKGITSEQLYKNIDLLRSYLEAAGAHISDSLLQEPNRSVQDAIEKLASIKTIEAHKDFEPIYYSVAEDKLALLDFQKNAVISHLLPAAYVAASLLRLLKTGRGSFTLEELDIKIDFLKGLLSGEFAAHNAAVNLDAINTTLDFFYKKGVVEKNDASDTEKIKVTVLGMEILTRYRAVIANFIDAYKIAFYTCSRIPPDESMDEKKLIKTMLQYGRHLLLLGQISRAEAISRPCFEHAIKLFHRFGLLKDELTDKDAKNKLSYRWNRSNAALDELQQELELFS